MQSVVSSLRHHAVVRRQPYEWTDTEPPLVLSHHGLWWEVVCGACGDDGGPYARQSGPVQSLRGPYASESGATAAASRHRIGAAVEPRG